MTEPVSTPEMSLHDRILKDVEGNILSGAWPPGYRIPFEHELTQHYNCARMTVNKAISELVKRGLIERRRRSGSFVTRPHGQSAVLEIHDIQREVQALGLSYRFELIKRDIRIATDEERAKLELQAGAKVLETLTLHYAGTMVFCVEERVINILAVPEVVEESFEDLAPGTWLLARVPWSAAEHRIRAAAAGKAVAEKLNLQAGTACLVIERRTWNNNLFITLVRVTYPGDQHELVAQFSPSQAV